MNELITQGYQFSGLEFQSGGKGGYLLGDSSLLER